MFSVKSPLMVVLLSFITCGVYGFIWLYQTSSELKYVLRNDNNPVLDLILCLVTFGIYYIYLMYRNAKQLVEVQKRFNLTENDVRLINVLLCIFGFGALAYGITQDVMNRCSIEAAMDQVQPHNQGPEYF